MQGVILIGYLALTVVMTWPLTPRFFSAIPGDGFDGWQNYWNLWWVKLALVDRIQNPFVTDILFAPTGVGLYFHTLNPFNGLVTLPVQVSAGLTPAYNTVVYLSWTLAGYGVYLLTRYTLRGVGRAGARHQQIAAFVAGAIFTFSPFHMAHLLGHMQVMSLQWIPFYILYLLRSMDRAQAGQTQTVQTWMRDALWAGFFLVLTGLCDWYFVLYLMLFTGFVIVWRGLATLLAGQGAGIGTRGVQLGAILAPALVAGSVFAVALSPILVPMVREVTAFSFMVRPATDLYILSASLADFLVPNRLHTLLRPESFEWVGNRIAPVSERTIAIGYLPLVLLGVGLWRGRGRAGVWGAIALFFVLLALGPRLHVGDITWDDIPLENTEAVLRGEKSLFGLLNNLVPLVRMSRSVSRYALMVQLAVAVAAGVGLAALGGRGLGRWGLSALGAGAFMIILAEFWVAPYPMSPPDTPDYYTRLDAEAPPGAVLNLPMNWDRPGYLLYQTEHGRPLTVAYISRDDPRTATTRYPVLQHLRHLGADILTDDPARVGKTVLADLGVGVVTLDRYKMPGGEEREVTEAVAAQVFGDDLPLYVDDRLTVYGVTAPAQPMPYLALGPLDWGALAHAQTADLEGETRADTDADEPRWRVVGAVAAEIWVHHAPPGSALTVRAASGSAAGTVLEVMLPDGTVEALSLTPDAQTWTVTWDAPLSDPVPGSATAALPQIVGVRAPAGDAQIFALTLVPGS